MEEKSRLFKSSVISLNESTLRKKEANFEFWGEKKLLFFFSISICPSLLLLSKSIRSHVLTYLALLPASSSFSCFGLRPPSEALYHCSGAIKERRNFLCLPPPLIFRPSCTQLVLLLFTVASGGKPNVAVSLLRALRHMDCKFRLRRRYIIGILNVGPKTVLLLYVSNGIDARRLYWNSLPARPSCW